MSIFNKKIKLLFKTLSGLTSIAGAFSFLNLSSKLNTETVGVTVLKSGYSTFRISRQDWHNEKSVIAFTYVKKIIKKSLGLILVPAKTLSTISCSSDFVSYPHYSESKTSDGYNVWRIIHEKGINNNSFNRFLDPKSIELIDYPKLLLLKFINEDFKTKNKELLEIYNQLNEKSDTKLSETEAVENYNDKKLTENRIIYNWLDYIKKKPLTLINDLNKLPEEFKNIRDKFKNVDFKKELILIVNGPDHLQWKPGYDTEKLLDIPGNVGQVIDKLEIDNNKIKISSLGNRSVELNDLGYFEK